MVEQTSLYLCETQHIEQHHMLYCQSMAGIQNSGNDTNINSHGTLYTNLIHIQNSANDTNTGPNFTFYSNLIDIQNSEYDSKQQQKEQFAHMSICPKNFLPIKTTS